MSALIKILPRGDTRTLHLLRAEFFEDRAPSKLNYLYQHAPLHSGWKSLAVGSTLSWGLLSRPLLELFGNFLELLGNSKTSENGLT
jgi:hypothetical protein